MVRCLVRVLVVRWCLISVAVVMLFACATFGQTQQVNVKEEGIGLIEKLDGIWGMLDGQSYQISQLTESAESTRGYVAGAELTLRVLLFCGAFFFGFGYLYSVMTSMRRAPLMGGSD